MNSLPASSTPQVPTRKRVLWGLGGVADCLIINGLNGLIDQIYTIGMALDPKWVGIARSVPRFLDMITDPLVGHLSDNTRSRWGRRKPWMLAGVIVSAVTAVVMWQPKHRHAFRRNDGGGKSAADGAAFHSALSAAIL